ncbi:MAG: hypothetical protein AAF226_11290 [Verrucomicrobiota bacterium]
MRYTPLLFLIVLLSAISCREQADQDSSQTTDSPQADLQVGTENQSMKDSPESEGPSPLSTPPSTEEAEPVDPFPEEVAGEVLVALPEVHIEFVDEVTTLAEISDSDLGEIVPADSFVSELSPEEALEEFNAARQSLSPQWGKLETLVDRPWAADPIATQEEFAKYRAAVTAIAEIPMSPDIRPDLTGKLNAEVNAAISELQKKVDALDNETAANRFNTEIAILMEAVSLL